MAKRRGKRGKNDSESDEPKRPTPAPDATTSLGSLLKAAKVSVVKPPRTLAPPGPESLRPASLPPRFPKSPIASSTGPGSKPSPTAELRMLNDAYAGVRPLEGQRARKVVISPERKRVTQIDREEEAAARKRLAALVAGGIHFKVKSEDGYVIGHRAELQAKQAQKLSSKSFAPDDKLDLHGERAARVSEVVSGFVRTHHRRGAKQLLIIVGKGLHSEDGQGVLLDALIDALTHGGAAPLVRAFATAHSNLGGTGAVAVLLV